MLLILNNNSATNPQTLTLSNEIDVQQGQGLDPAAPTYSDKQFTRALLKEGGVYTFEHADMKEVIFPLLVGAGLNLTSSQVAARVQLINNIINTPGATAEWQDDGMSQPTYYPVTTGILDVDYDFRSQSSAHFVRCRLRLFALPFVTPASPRFYAMASGIGPLLMITPYGSNGSLQTGATTINGIAGFGSVPNPYHVTAPSSGVFYGGNPSLAGDAPARLQLTYVGPNQASATGTGLVPVTALSVLPDGNYQPYLNYAFTGVVGTATAVGGLSLSTAVAGTYSNFTIPPFSAGASGFLVLTVSPTLTTLGTGGASAVPANWAGNHRLFGVMRASAIGNVPTPFIQSIPGPYNQIQSTATISVCDWQLYDLGVYTMRASEVITDSLQFIVYASTAASQAVAVDTTAFFSLPDNTTWFLNPAQINGNRYGWPSVNAVQAAIDNISPYSNTILVDDTIPDQFIAWSNSINKVPSPAMLGASAAPISAYSRGLVPLPDPKFGIPPIAILGVGPAFAPLQTTIGGAVGGASWANPQNKPTYAQVNILERARYVLN